MATSYLDSGSILVMVRGKIVERGTQNDLLALNGSCVQFYETQLKRERV